jgi:hypothetical protein
MKSWFDLVCIISVGGLNFKFELLIFKSIHFDTCLGTPRSCIQVCPTKFTFVKIRSRENFGEFIIFFTEGLDPFKIHRRFKFEYILGFVT